MINFAEADHPIFRATSALENGELRIKGKGNKSIHFNGSATNIELILRTMIFCKSAQSLRSSCRFVQRTYPKIQKLQGKRAADERVGINGKTYRISNC